MARTRLRERVIGPQTKKKLSKRIARYKYYAKKKLTPGSKCGPKRWQNTCQCRRPR